MLFFKFKVVYSLVLLTNKKLVGVRDPFGIRPLVIGKLKNSHILASETCALDIIGATFVREGRKWRNCCNRGAKINFY